MDKQPTMDANSIELEEAETVQILPGDTYNAVLRRQYLHNRVKELPKEVQQRVEVLKNMQLEQIEIDKQFCAELFEIQKKFQARYEPLYNKRKDIITGKVQPPAQESTGEPCEDIFSVRIPDDQDYANIIKSYKNVNQNTVGIPNFWLTIFKTSNRLRDIITDEDELVLEKLIDIRVKYQELYVYTLEFYFDENDYFNDEVLYKKCYMRVREDPNCPYSIDGAATYKCEGCTIHWKENKNVTIKKVTVLVDNVEMVREEPISTFFSFFDETNYEADDEIGMLVLNAHCEISEFMREELIPKAVLYFNGFVVDDDSVDKSLASSDEEEKKSDLLYSSEGEEEVKKPEFDERDEDDYIESQTNSN